MASACSWLRVLKIERVAEGGVGVLHERPGDDELSGHGRVGVAARYQLVASRSVRAGEHRGIHIVRRARAGQRPEDERRRVNGRGARKGGDIGGARSSLLLIDRSIEPAASGRGVAIGDGRRRPAPAANARTRPNTTVITRQSAALASQRSRIVQRNL